MAAGLPVLLLVLAVALSAVTIGGARVRVQDAAREAARAAARGDRGAAITLAARAAPGVTVRLTTAGDEVIATARLRVHPIASWLPAVVVSEQAVALIEPAGGSP